MRPRQVQDFIPTPMAIATAMFYTGIDPLTMQPVEVVRDLREKKRMKALLYWWDEEKWPLAREAPCVSGVGYRSHRPPATSVSSLPEGRVQTRPGAGGVRPQPAQHGASARRPRLGPEPQTILAASAYR